MPRHSVISAFLGAALIAVPTEALAWGFEGHQVVALIARSYLSAPVRGKVDAILAADPDALTDRDMAARATWADAYRGAGHRETAQWHFADYEIDHLDVDAACFGHPASERPASAGPSRACVVDRIEAFATELGDPDTAPAERILALKFVLHLVGDVHQPLHAADNHDRGGNCVLVGLGGTRAVNLHSYWDTVIVRELGSDSKRLAQDLRGKITPAQLTAWRQGAPRSWAMESYSQARTIAYSLGSPPGCGRDAAPIRLPSGYDAEARRAAALQLKKAGVRLALLLERSLAHVSLAGLHPAGTAQTAPPAVPTSRRLIHRNGRSPESVGCSEEADRLQLHGPTRQRYRRTCLKKAAARASAGR